MSPSYKFRKMEKKRKRCELNVQIECRIAVSKEGPTKYVAILNAGLSTGLTEELVLETVEKYGKIKKLLMLPNKSYCFMECADVSDAVSIVSCMHGLAPIGQNESVVYLNYFEKLPDMEDSTWLRPLPEGLIVIKDIITENEELTLLKALEMDHISDQYSLKHRRVKHFGYEFLYDINNVNPKKKLDREIPRECNFLWKRLETIYGKELLSFDWQEPDQLTVNSYEVGQGIPPHVDTHSAFLDPIISLSLEGNVVMDFRRGSESRSVYLPRRSLLIMSGESRYDWTHGIAPRAMDVILTSKGNLSTQRRSKRTSLTFRKIRNGPCFCKYPTLCDSSLKQKWSSKEVGHIECEKAAILEEHNVHKIYDKIADHFHETRHSPWPRVVEFLKSFQQSSVLIDVGCGNGKYLNANPTLLNVGCDRSSSLLEICNSFKYNVFRCDCLHIPVRSNSVDGCISIAVIHHLATVERRLRAIKELVRILRPGGRGLIYVWAKDQSVDNKKSSYLRQNKLLNNNKVTEDELRQETRRQLDEQAKEAPVTLTVHSNRTTFEQQDVLVPWKFKTPQNKDQEKQVFLRYYHVFEENELKVLFQEILETKVLKSYYDQGNICCLFEKVDCNN